MTPEQVKKEIRKLKNRIAAQKCREQKEIKIAQAEGNVKNLENENLALKQKTEWMQKKLEHYEFRMKQHMINCGTTEQGKRDFPELFSKTEQNFGWSRNEFVNPPVYGVHHYSNYNNNSAFNIQPTIQPKTQVVDQPANFESINYPATTVHSVQNDLKQNHAISVEPSPIHNYNPVGPSAQPVIDNSLKQSLSPSENNIIQRRNSSSSKRKFQGQLNNLDLSGISNKQPATNREIKFNSLPVPRRSPRIKKLKESMTPAPKTKDIINELAGYGTGDSAFNFSDMMTPSIVEKELRNDSGQTGFTPLLGSFKNDGPLTRSAKRLRDSNNFF